MEAKALNVFLVVLVAAALSWIGCAVTQPQLTPLQMPEKEFVALEAEVQPQLTPLQMQEKEFVALEVKVQQKLEEAKEARTAVEQKKGALAGAYRKEAKSLMEMSVELKKQGEGYKAKAEELDSPAKKAEKAEPKKTEVAPEYLDIRVDSFTLSGIKRLTPYPSVWLLGVKVDKEIMLSIGKERLTLIRPEDFSPPVCYRVCPKCDRKVAFCPYKLPVGDNSSAEKKD